MDGKQMPVEKVGIKSTAVRGLQSAPCTGKEILPEQGAPRTVTAMRGPKLPRMKR